MKPTDKSQPEQREKLKNLSSILAKTHKAMIDHLFLEREKIDGYPMATGGRLQLLLGDPNFQWLRALSQLMTMIDDIYFQKEVITEEQLTAAKAETRKLMVDKENAEFAVPYQAMIDLLPDVAFEQGRLLEALKNFNLLQ